MSKRLLALFLAVFIVVTFGACSSRQESPSSTIQTSESTSASASTSANPGPVAKLQIFNMINSYTGLQTGHIADLLKKKCNVELEALLSGAQALQKLQAMMATGELPDIVIFNSKDQVKNAIEAEMLLCMDDYLDNLPSVKHYAPVNMQYSRDEMSAGTGKLYALPLGVGESRIGSSNWTPHLRWDLYKKLGMPEIKTVEDYLDVIKQMQQLEPTTPDGQKVYGFSLWKDWDVYSMFLASEFANLRGIDCGDQLSSSLPLCQINLKNGDLKSILDLDSEYINGLKLYFKANQMGLLDPDSLTQTFQNAQDKYTNGRALFSHWSWLPAGYNSQDNINAEEPKGFQPVYSNDYLALLDPDYKVGIWFSAAVGASTKHPDAACKVVDMLFDPDALVEIFYGPEGLTWEFGSDGKPALTKIGWEQILDPTKEIPGTEILSKGNCLGSALTPSTKSPMLNDYMYNKFWQSYIDQYPYSKLERDWQKATGFKNADELIASKKNYVKMSLGKNFVPPLPDDIQRLATQIGDVVKTYSWTMVLAKNQAEFDKLLNEMINKANGLGIDKLIEWDKNAWKIAEDMATKYK